MKRKVDVRPERRPKARRMAHVSLLQANTTIPTPKTTVPLKTRYLAPNRSDNGPAYIPNPKLTTKYSEKTQANVPSLMSASCLSSDT